MYDLDIKPSVDKIFKKEKKKSPGKCLNNLGSLVVSVTRQA
jgi:hypothetical protein